MTNMKKLLCSLTLLAATASLQAAPIWLWGNTENAYLVRIDATTGDTVVVGNTTLGGSNLMLNDIAIDVNGQMYGITHTSFYRVDKSTGMLTFIGNHTIQSGAGLGIASDGLTVLGVGSGSQSLFSIDTATGASTAFAGSMNTEASGDIASYGSQLFMTASGNSAGGHVLVEIDPATGNSIGGFGPAEYGQGIWPAKGIATGSDNILYIGSRDRVYAIPTSGMAFGIAVPPGVAMNIISGAPIGTDLGQIRGLASELPEPGTWAMLGTGLLALGFARRRR
jgi:hypothetical protein